MRRDDETVELIVGIIGEREDHPVGVALARAHLDAAHDAVGALRGGDLNAIHFGLLSLDRIGQIDGGRIRTHADGVQRMRGRTAREDGKAEREGC